MGYAKAGESETSCGAVVINNKRILFIKSKQFQIWNIPKGHLEKGETELECALREVKEETGLDDLEVIPEFKKQVTYENELFKTIKTVILFVFLSKKDDIDLSHGENDDYRWCGIEEAMPIINEINAKDILIEAVDFAKEKGLL
ncbi:NUDIX domain-containing protein [Thermoproteota archaeon]